MTTTTDQPTWVQCSLGSQFNVLTHDPYGEPVVLRQFDRLDDAAQFTSRRNQTDQALRDFMYAHGGNAPEGELLEAAREYDLDVEEIQHDVWADLEAERFERLCNRTLLFGSGELYQADCDLDAGHDGPHEADAMEGRVSWTGGGWCAGDPLPARNVTWTF